MQVIDSKYESEKTRNLVLGLLFDAIGMLSAAIPIIGEFGIDFIWAPISGILMSLMYQGKKGKVAGVFSFLEEIIPYTDIIPSFTLMWILTYIIRKPKPTTSRR